MDSIQSIVWHRACQLTNALGQLRSMSEELKKIQANQYNAWMEGINDKEKLKSFMLSLSN